MIRVANWPGELQFEAGGVGKLGEFVDGLGAGRALVVCGKTVAGGEMLERVRAGLGSRCAGVFDGAQMHTPLVTVLEAANLFLQEKADLIISVGGGSAVDTGKGIALMIAGGGELEPYRLKETPHRPLPPDALPHISVPTVPRPASDFLPFATILDPETETKMRFQDPLLVPKITVLDARLSAHCGPGLTASTGLGAMVRCFENLYSKDRNPLSSGLAPSALGLLAHALPLGISEPDNLKAREDCFYASVMVAMAGGAAGVNVIHAIGLAIGVRYKLPHGLPHAILAPPAMKALLGDAERPAREALGSGEDAAQSFARLVGEMGVDPHLRAHGIERSNLLSIAQAAVPLPMMAHAPRPVEAAEINLWLEEVW